MIADEPLPASALLSGDGLRTGWHPPLYNHNIGDLGQPEPGAYPWAWLVAIGDHPGHVGEHAVLLRGLAPALRYFVILPNFTL